jgi:hypothetical protein
MARRGNKGNPDWIRGLGKNGGRPKGSKNRLSKQLSELFLRGVEAHDDLFAGGV